MQKDAAFEKYNEGVQSKRGYYWLLDCNGWIKKS